MAEETKIKFLELQRLAPRHIDMIRQRAGGAISLNENTTAHQAGYMLGVQKVLEILREGFVVDGNQTT